MSGSPGDKVAEKSSVLAKVSRNGHDLRHAADELKGDFEIVLAAVKSSGLALRYAAEELKGDREIVLAAVKAAGSSLRFATEACKCDREIVLAAVRQHGPAIQYAAEEYRGDPDMVLAAMGQCEFALAYAAEELVLDPSFAMEAKKECFILKISLLSGRYKYVVTIADMPEMASDIIEVCCREMGLGDTVVAELVQGDAVVPGDAHVKEWPGIGPPGEISEYILVVRPSC